MTKMSLFVGHSKVKSHRNFAEIWRISS